jgi:hypothetical protein
MYKNSFRNRANSEKITTFPHPKPQCHHSTIIPREINYTSNPSANMTRIKSLLFTLPQRDIPPQPKVLHSFTIFPKLAPEIRAMIWKHAAFES